MKQISRNEILSKSLVIVGFAVSLFIFLFDNILIKVLTVSMLGFILPILTYQLCKDWKSPFVILPPIGVLYYTVFPIYYFIGGDRTYSVSEQDVIGGLNCSYLFYLGIFLAFIFSDVKENQYGLINRGKYFCYGLGKFESYLLLFLFTLIFSYSFVQINAVSGMTKEERMLTGAVSFSVFFGGIYFFYAYLLILGYFLYGRLNKSVFIFIISVGFLGAFILGERDQLVFPILFTTFIYSYFNHVKLKRIIYIAFFILLIMYALELYRGFQQSNELRKLSGLVYILQENEFVGAGRNIAFLIGLDIDKLYGLTIAGDLLHSIFVNILPTGVQWYSDNYIQNKGLSIVGELYINFGYVGCFFGGYIFILSINFLYKKSFVNNFYTVIYIISIIAALYSLRSDFAAIPSGIAKKFLVPLICLIILRFFFNKFKFYRITNNGV